MVDQIRTLLARRGAELLNVQAIDAMQGQVQLGLARMIVKRYRVFDVVRQAFNAGGGQCGFVGIEAEAQDLLETLCNSGYVRKDDTKYMMSDEPDKIRFLTGGWLEELTYHSVLEAGADVAVVGQRLHWSVQQYHGLSEIDVIARKGDRLLFVSCKSVKAELKAVETRRGQNQRKQLMDYLHEADNLADHFGMPGDVAALVVTTDLIDESAGHKARYSALFGKALRLDVELVTLEDVRWGNLVARFRRIIEGMGAH